MNEENEVDYHFTTNIKSDNNYAQEFNKEQQFQEQTPNFLQQVLSVPEKLDKFIGIHDTRQKAIKAATFGLSEEHWVAALAGEMLVPDSLDLITLGLGYIPRRVLGGGSKAIKAFLKTRKGKFARKAPDLGLGQLASEAGIGTKIAGEADYEAMIKAAKELEIEELSAAEKIGKVTGQTPEEVLMGSGKRQYVNPSNNPNPPGTPSNPPYLGKNTTLAQSDAFLQTQGLLPFNEEAFRNYLLQFTGSSKNQKARSAANRLQGGLFGATRPKAFDKSYRSAYASLAQYFGNPAIMKSLKLEDHHVNAIMAGLPLYEGIKTFDEAEQITKALLRRGIGSGNDPRNFRLLPEKVHKMVHRFIGEQMGYYFDSSGNLSKLGKKVRNMSMADRLKEVNNYADLVKESDIVATSVLAQMLELMGNDGTKMLRRQDWEDFYDVVTTQMKSKKGSKYILGDYAEINAEAQKVLRSEDWLKRSDGLGLVRHEVLENSTPKYVRDLLYKRDELLLSLKDGALNSQGKPYGRRAIDNFKSQLAQVQQEIDNWIQPADKITQKEIFTISNPYIKNNYGQFQDLIRREKPIYSRPKKKILDDLDE
tara:strand:+ start:474 stop:2249 length:1776 start_codon:yes stop_codon:yes gene_type:complete